MGACTSTPVECYQDSQEPPKGGRDDNHDIHSVHQQQMSADSMSSSSSCVTPTESTETGSSSKLSEHGYLRDIPLGAWFPAKHAHRDIAKLFTKCEEIASGATGTVYCVKYQDKLYALKQISRDDQVGRMLFTTEARVLSSLKHPGIVQYIDMFADRHYYYLITQRADFNLYHVMQRKQYLSEKQTKRIIYELLGAVRHLHRKNLVHRDLKPENIVFRSEEPNKPLLIDFGDAEMAKAEKVYTEFVGTPGYMAPERLGKHTGAQLKKSDVWAIGVIAYEMYAGDRCFAGDSEQAVFRNIVHGEWQWPDGRLPSASMQHFVAKCLELDAQQRLSARDALLHAWFHDVNEV
eukprot:CAMPEP_0197034044 /NCGR_PEP_ID=MMETSP1384-20130603/12265_1 /TAXON_ID=29189 /ORGANISM="Ammonia sp." /LENGTH=348 /DNA_ID=CAMNT_0042463919 /DNA_START=37 /DNA_END=1083 /DNA_ORIENTATION=+